MALNFSKISLRFAVLKDKNESFEDFFRKNVNEFLTRQENVVHPHKDYETCSIDHSALKAEDGI